MALYEQYNNLAMPNMHLNKQEAVDLIAYMDEESQRIRGSRQGAPEKSAHKGSETPRTAAFTVSQAEPADDVVAIMNAWIREPHPEAKTVAGYMTLVNVGPEDVTLVKVESEAFENIELHEMAMVDGLMTMAELPEMFVPAGGQARFEPGGTHLMLRGPRQHLAKGHKVEMTLIFRSGKEQRVSFTVADK